MLDEEHGTPANFEQRTDDKNSYSWGRIGEHNVVIASLQAGLYGIVPAAVTAQSMLLSFPKIKIGLLVAIGAGIARPEKDRDIRLGDVVVSQPSGTNGGVLQYNLVKAEENHLERKGFLNKPPAALLNTLGKLQAEHELPGRSLVASFLGEIGSQYPEMDQYLYQGTENDKLFNSTDRHLGGTDCSRCDKAYQAIRRSPRRSTAPKIHYGTIASGDILMKDGVFGTG
ncbi:hypothetical protein AnigIFM60653_010821 [Aspergillus niger]|nr:hypothetical protein AnigIFM60653_010821 [Aspergillus niger]